MALVIGHQPSGATPIHDQFTPPVPFTPVPRFIPFGMRAGLRGEGVPSAPAPHFTYGPIPPASTAPQNYVLGPRPGAGGAPRFNPNPVAYHDILVSLLGPAVASLLGRR